MAIQSTAQVSTSELKKSVNLFEEMLQNKTCVQGEMRWTDQRWYFTSNLENCISNQQAEGHKKVKASALKQALKKGIAYVVNYSEILPGNLSFKYTIAKEDDSWSIEIWNGITSSSKKDFP